jgi:hypothetical protein
MTAVPEGTMCDLGWRTHATGVDGVNHCPNDAAVYKQINGELVALCQECLADMNNYEDEFLDWVVLP